MSTIKTNKLAHTANGASEFTLPQTDGSANQIIKTDGSGALAFTDGIPSQSGNSGKYLTTNGSTASWGTVAGGGKILQVVSTTKTDFWSQSTSSNTAFYDITNLNATITPTTSGNKILIFVSLNLGSNQSTQRMGVRTVVSVGGGSDTVIGNSTETGSSVNPSSMGSIELHRVYTVVPTAYQYLYTTSSTNAHVFKPQVAQEPSGTSTIYINRTALMNSDAFYSSVSTITLMEVAQ